jgi:serine/threonine protein kinase
MATESVGPGTLLGGDFRLVQPLSSGGMGALFVAEQLSTGKRRAVKVMHSGLLDSPALRERFAREARIGSLVASDHVVEVVSAGVDGATGAPWIAMELLEGDDLAAHLARNGPAPVPHALEIVRQLCHALGAAHAAGVVHRDIKPENVFIVATKSAAGQTSVKVLDFGIAKIAAQMRTAHTGVLGTPLWMAPEQTDPAAEAGPAADVWAVGLLTFWLLTGKHFWKSASIPSSSMHALMREILFDPIPLASQRAAELGVAPYAPPGLDAWLARCLEREVSARFANANEAFAALSTALAPGAATTAAGVVVAQTSPPPRPSIGAEAPTLVAAAPKPASRAIWLAVPVLGIGVLALGAVGIGAAYFTGVFGDGQAAGPLATAPAIPSPVAPSPAPSSVAETQPEAAPAPTTKADAPATAGPAKTAAPKTPAKAPPSSTPPAAPKPFDNAAAQTAIQQKASFARLSCSNKPGPRAYSVSIVFRNEGVVQRVDMNPQDRATSAGVCVAMIMSGTRVPPYDGPQQTVGAGVALNPEKP